MKQFTLRIRCWRRDGSKSPTFRSNTGFNLYASNVKINESWFSRGSTCCLYSGSELKWSYPEMYINLQTFGLPHFALPVVPWTPILANYWTRSTYRQPLRCISAVAPSCWPCIDKLLRLTLTTPLQCWRTWPWPWHCQRCDELISSEESKCTMRLVDIRAWSVSEGHSCGKPPDIVVFIFDIIICVNVYCTYNTSTTRCLIMSKRSSHMRQIAGPRLFDCGCFAYDCCHIQQFLL